LTVKKFSPVFCVLNCVLVFMLQTGQNAHPNS